ncbi:transcription repressor NadR [Alkalibacillus haloalkaliphilus]|uniref:transcription repressor NadR n=1 Tax=Alkalibacillus haloalkaliphilus TaxID=94136 RepID=UPI0029361768|nr:transcription repressor NadR [Alkalibacillus haloalkaliphilus]MDV2580919.1 transcription repressor NadR [Alkalibacillus haloalkaliphilus]
MTKQKLSSNERREQILNALKQTAEPKTGKELSELYAVSRQVIVGDIALLKAQNEPIMSTSQGYIYMSQQEDTPRYERTIACCHNKEQTEEELNILVDHGVYVKDVIVDHPIYGEFKAVLHISNRVDVKKFKTQVDQSNAALLSELTGGVHLHTIAADEEELLDQAEQALRDQGFIVED